MEHATIHQKSPNAFTTTTPSFEPYVLSQLDHHAPPVCLAGFMFFRLNDTTNQIATFEAGVARLVTLLPFLAGNIAPSSRVPGKENVFEVQPATAECLSQNPMFRTKKHNLPLSSQMESHAVSKDHILDASFVPEWLDDSGVEPVLRFQANMMLDGIILCVSFHHQAVDGVGMVNVTESLAVCCSNPNATVDLLPTTPQKEQTTRDNIWEIASSFNLAKKPDQEVEMPGSDLASTMQDEGPISRMLVLSAEKLEQLQKSCIDRRQFNGQKTHLTGNAIVTAVLWLCVLRAQSTLAIAKNEPVPAACSALMLSNVRSTLQPNLPKSYMGNALGHSKSNTLVQPIMSASPPDYSRGRPSLHDRDINILASLARDVSDDLKTVTNESMRELLSTRAAAADWAPTAGPADINVSSMRVFDGYNFDFGPSLGKAFQFDIPERRVAGMAWVMPARGGDRYAPWDLRVTLLPEIMERVQKDSLMRWLSPNTAAKL